MKTTNLTAALLLTLTTLALPVHADDEGVNNSCPGEAYTPDGTGFEYGTLSATDTQDFYRFYAQANWVVALEMNPGYQSGSDYALHVYDPNCFIIVIVNHGGTSIERYDFVAPSSGYYSAAVVRYSGSGWYDLQVSVYPQPAEYCYDQESPTVLGGMSCSVEGPQCGTWSCDYRVTVSVTGTGYMSAQAGGATCAGVNGCSTWYTVYGVSGHWPSCSTTTVTAALNGRLTCKVEFV